MNRKMESEQPEATTMTEKCPFCGKEYEDLAGLPAKRRLQAHINAVHGRLRWRER